MTSPNVQSVDYNALFSTTLQNYQPTLVDNIFKDLVLLNHMNSGGRVVMEEGGTQIVEPVLYEENSTAASYSGYDNIALTPQDGITSAIYDWKQIAASIAISGIEEAQNRGTEAIIKLLNAKIMQAEMSIKSLVNGQLLSSNNGTGGTAKEFNGIGGFAGSLNTAIGGIDAATSSWWNPTIPAGIQGAALSLVNMANVYNNASKGNDTPDLIITTEALFSKFESLLTPNVRYQDVAKANSGFQNLMFKQTPVVFDLAMPGNQVSNASMYFLNTKYLKLTGMNGHWWTTTPFQQGTVAQKDARYAIVLAYGQLTCSNRARQGYLSADA
jgi:hypothetical protein